MNLKARIEELERKYPDIRSMEAECIRADGRCDWLSLEELIKEGLLSRRECNAVDFVDNPAKVDFDKLHENRFALLHKAY